MGKDIRKGCKGEYGGNTTCSYMKMGKKMSLLKLFKEWGESK
jgi:hypothetical protein